VNTREIKPIWAFCQQPAFLQHNGQRHSDDSQSHKHIDQPAHAKAKQVRASRISDEGDRSARPPVTNAAYVQIAPFSQTPNNVKTRNNPPIVNSFPSSKAVTVAVREPPASRAISPKQSPYLRTATRLPPVRTSKLPEPIV
jgi:hypothetical protein